MDTGALRTDPALHGAWEEFSARIEPLRPDLFRFSLKLTGNPFDAEDLVHDAMLKAFGSLALYRHQIHDPRAYMLRALSHLWIDSTRRAAYAAHPDAAAGEAAEGSGDQELELREAAGRLLANLEPRQQVIVVMKEVFGLSHREIAAIVSMSEGAVKVALHRSKARLAATRRSPGAAPELVERFVAVFQTHDMDAVKALLTEDFEADVFPAGAGTGRDFAAEEGWLHGCFYHHIPEREAARDPYPLHLEVRELAGEPVVLVFRDHGAGNVLEEVWRFESDGERLSAVKDYGFCPDLVRHVAERVGVTPGQIGYRFEHASYGPGPQHR